VVTSIALCGCSFVFVHGPKPPPAPPNDCTSSRLVPILDGVATGLFAVYAIYSAVTSDADYRSSFCDQFDSSCTPPPRALTVTTSAVIAAVAGVSAYVGRNRVNECQAASYAPVMPPAAPLSTPSPSPNPNPPNPNPNPTPTPTPTKPSPTPTNPRSGSGSGDLPIPPSGLPVPGGT